MLHGKAHWIFESDEIPAFASKIKIVDITNFPHVQEGWEYDAGTGTFAKPQSIEYPSSPLIEQQMKSLEKRVQESENALVILMDMTLMGGQ